MLHLPFLVFYELGPFAGAETVYFCIFSTPCLSTAHTSRVRSSRESQQSTRSWLL